ncbi:caspase family protein [Mangrovicoccus algicola]|uniref:Caspase family protein n=1 Tax=Mangrovicoccus algicola TaxID=2771008 RepID=A0A8J6YZD1_9RHOB|nr:caspase family protein [Mangrovicoccus algicola]MBE3640450.1 caspase family protein [Mangrovicoccus algicola]
MRFLTMAVLLLLAPCVAAASEARIALVIGNAGYEAVTPLDNAGNDSRLVAGALREAGFEVTLVQDAGRAALTAAVAAFGRDLRSRGPETVGLFYYAGHGIQSFGANYLLPVDARLSDAADLDLVAVDAASVLRQMGSAGNRTNIVILDACRNNPFEAIRDLDDSGLAEMKAPTGTFLAYATAPGAVALDGTGANSPFSAALAEAMAQQGQPIEQAFKAVRRRVLEETAGRQTPWDTSSLTGDFMFRPPPPLSAEMLAGQRLWTAVRASRDPVQVMLFLRSYPDSPEAAEARDLLAALVAEELDTTVPAPPDLSAKAGPAAADAPAAEAAPVFFDRPMTEGAPEIVGRTIMEVTRLHPLFPPIEGLPEAVWKTQTCSGCHAWTREALCTQAQVYLAEGATRAVAKDHPMGGSFKRNLRSWAAGGCR